MQDSTETPTATAPFFEAYAVGMLYASVCTNLTDEEATRELNVAHWTGMTPWEISADPTFASGEPNPNPCEDRADCRHILFNC